MKANIDTSKDKKHWYSIDEAVGTHMASSGVIGVYIYLPFWFLLTIWSGDFSAVNYFFVINTIIIVTSAFIRYQLVVQNKRSNKPINSYLAILISMFAPLHWGVLSAYFLYSTVGLHDLKYAILMLLVLFSAGGISLLSFSRRLGISYVLLTCMLTVLLSLLYPEILSGYFRVFVLMLFAMLIWASKVLNHEYLTTHSKAYELKTFAKSMENLSKIDFLTQTNSRFGFMLEFEKVWLDHIEQQKPLSILLIDIDVLQALREAEGFKNGEACLKQFSAILKYEVETPSVLALFGGQEFVIALAEAELQKAINFANHLNERCNQEMFVSESGNEYRFSCSIGIATCIPNYEKNPEDLFNSVDQALSQAKEKGGNTYYSQQEML